MFKIIFAFITIAFAGEPLKPVQITTPPGVPTPLPFEQRGHETIALYHQYVKRLKQDYTDLRNLLMKEAPKLFQKLNLPPPKPVKYGYQILPKITPDQTDSTPNPQKYRARSVSYSWAKTESFIQAEIPKLEEIEEKMKFAPKLSRKDRMASFESMLTDYKVLEENQRTIDSHIQYNSFWQKAIHDDKARFERLTELHDLALDRQNTIDKLNSTYDRDEIERLNQKEQSILRQIHEKFENLNLAKFVKVKNPTPNVWVFEVPVLTDIQNDVFISRFKQSVENAWRVESREMTFKVTLALKKVSPKRLYSKSTVPRIGSPIDVQDHIEKFKKVFGEKAGIVTTGSNSTYAIPGSYIALGPQDTTPNVLAHEFGHILGFVDGYFRGFHDLGSQGYEVLEIVPDAEDIMSTPGNGRVLKSHFEKMSNAAAKASEPARLPAAQSSTQN